MPRPSIKLTLKTKLLFLGVFFLVGFWMMEGPRILDKLEISPTVLCQKQCDKVHRVGKVIWTTKSARGISYGPWDCQCS